MILFWVVGYLWKRTLPKRAEDIDIDVCTLRSYLSASLTNYYHTVWSQILVDG